MATDKYISLFTKDKIDNYIFKKILSTLQLSFKYFLDDDGFVISENDSILNELNFQNPNYNFNFNFSFEKTNYTFNKRSLFASITDHSGCQEILFDMDSFTEEEQFFIKKHLINTINNLNINLVLVSDLDFEKTIKKIDLNNICNEFKKIPDSIEFMYFKRRNEKKLK